MNSKRGIILGTLFFILAGLFIVPVVWETYVISGAASDPPSRPTLSSVVLVPIDTAVPPSPTDEPTTPPTDTPIPTDSSSPTAGPSPTPSHTPTITPTPTDTPIPSETPTSLPQHAPVLTVTGPPEFFDEGFPTPSTAVPSPVPTFEVPRDVTNVLLLGSDVSLETGDARTDTIIVVSINHDRKTASMISIPRDLFVYIPGWTMNRVNTALSRASAVGVPGGGIESLKQTILYNFGVPIHYYARIDFSGFQEIVDSMGGVDIAVSCRLEDWRIKSPDLDPQEEDNWERFVLEPGMYHMDGDLALWYARSRLSTNDFDRGRRQQQLLRGMLNQAVEGGLISQVPALWDAFQNTVDTDMDIGRMLQLAALAPAIRENGVQNLYLAGKTVGWTVPTSGASVHLPVWEGDGMMEETFTRLFLPPALNRATQAPIFVEIVNASGNPDMTALAADNLAWHGFIPIVGAEGEAQEETTLTYFGPNLKGAYGWLISWNFAMRESNIIINSEDEFPYNYQVVLGKDYDPCRPQFNAPQIFLDQGEEE